MRKQGRNIIRGLGCETPFRVCCFVVLPSSAVGQASCLLLPALCHNRYHSLRQLFSIPDSFVEEFVVQEPELLCMSADTLKAKFDSLLRR